MTAPNHGARADAIREPVSSADVSVSVSKGQHDARIRAAALRKAAEELATGGWADAFAEYGVLDDVGAVRAMEKWLNDRADRIARTELEGTSDE